MKQHQYPGLKLIATDNRQQYARRIADCYLGERSFILLPPKRDPLIQQAAASVLAGWRKPAAEPWFMVPTGGTTGAPRFVVHTPATLGSAAQGYVLRFSGPESPLLTGLTALVLPLYHVGGLLAFVRSMMHELGNRLCDYHLWFASSPRDLPPAGATVSLVPAMLHRIRAEGSDALINALRSCRMIMVGGAHLPAPLADWARSERLPLAPSYGLSETAAAVSVLDPRAFLGGDTSCGRPLSGVRLSFDDQQVLTVEAPSVALGYADALLANQPSPGFGCGPKLRRFTTADRGQLDARGHLHVLGRIDRVVNSGGRKIDATQIEQALLSLPAVGDVIVGGIPDERWGESVVVWYCGTHGQPPPTDSMLRDHLAPLLPDWALPKRWVPCPTVPRTPAGKPDWSALRALATSA
jgi:o-succinylbenzoate---CoA ligase